MKVLLLMLAHLLTTLAKLLGPGGAKAIDTFKISRHTQETQVSIAVHLCVPKIRNTQLNRIVDGTCIQAASLSEW